MEPIFTIQYGEYAVADYLKKEIKKTSVFIPTSAQEKGIDLLLYRFESGRNKIATIQVKMSRTYVNEKKEMPYSLWFSTFKVQENADWYILVGIYCTYKDGSKKKKPKTKWEKIILAFKNKEMKNFLSKIRQKKDTSMPDKMFGFRFDNNQHIVLSRGATKPIDMKRYLIKNRIKEIGDSLLKK